MKLAHQNFIFEPIFNAATNNSMKSISYSLLISTALLIASCSGTATDSDEQQGVNNHQMEEHQHDGGTAKDTDKKKPASPKQQAMAMVGNNHIHIEYSSPSVRDRVIWGGLVPYDKVWSTGAHMATSINFPQAVIISGTDIPAGKYGFFTIPGEEKWIIILNKNWKMHLSDNYKETEDVIRFEVTPEKMDAIQESLEYNVEDVSDKTGKISVAWEYLKISFEVTNK